MSRPWMPLYVADYLKDTLHLSAAESGAYLFLIMHYWEHGGLPADECQVARIARLTPKEWSKVGPTIAAFFGDGWTHKRIDEELAKSEDISRKRRSAVQQRKDRGSSNEPTIETTNEHTRARARPVVVDVIDTNTQSKEISSKPARAEKSRLGPPKKSPREELEVILSPRMADAVLEHRQRLRKPLSSLAASALASSFQETGDPEAAAFTMIERGWQGFQPDWLNGDRQPQKGRH